MRYLNLSTAMLMAALAPMAHAAKCSSEGALFYVGTLSRSTESVWLSRNLLDQSDRFRLESAQNASPSFSETFGIQPLGMHVSFSPVVSNGSGGTHKLYSVSSGRDCLLDTQNQKNGIEIGGGNNGGGGGTGGGTTPPGGGNGGSGGGTGGGTDGGGSTGGGGGGTGGGTTPPGGGNGGSGGGSGGGTDGGGSTGGGGGGTGGGTTPPGGGNGGSGGGTGGGTDGGGSSGGGGGDGGGTVFQPHSAALLATTQLRAESITQRVVQGMAPALRVTQSNDALADAPLLADSGPDARAVTRLPQRELGEWSSWGDWRRLEVSDNRWSRDLDGQLLQYQLGVDRMLDDRRLLGLAVAYETADAHQFNSQLDSDLQRVVVGPYFGYQLGARSYLDAWLGYSWSRSEAQLAGMQADIDSHDWFVSLNLTGVLTYGDYQVLPKATLYYSEVRSEDSDVDVWLGGRYRGSLKLDGQRDDFGYAGGSVELSRRWAGRWNWQPYVRLGSYYTYQQLQDGYLLDGDLQFRRASRWTQQGSLGVRTQLDSQWLLEAQYSDLALGDSDLDIRQWKLSANYWF